MSARIVAIKTNDGTAPCHYFETAEKGPHPAVIIYMDAFGVRPALCDMAGRLASHGYNVLLPDLYYRAGPTQSFEPGTAFTEGPMRDRIMGLYKSINQKLVMEDTAHFLEFLAAQPAVGGKVGCLGYCMGGGYALTAAGTFPDRVGAAASFHGARLATDQPDSPHLLAPKMRGEIYVGIAALDTHFSSEEKLRLEKALEAAGVRHTVEVYEGVKHGFAVNDMPVFDRAAAEKHWQAILRLFRENL